ncbi:energy transducer TonB [bacterium]|nr:energy transducer TonB [bacterium]
MFIALAIHGLIILGIVFAPTDQSAASSQRLEVTLSHHQSDKAPKDADFIAEHNQIGSGTLEEEKQLLRNATAILEDTQIKPAEAIVVPQEAQAPLTEIPPNARLVTTSGDSWFTMRLDQPEDELPTEESKEPQEFTMEMLSQEIASLEAKLHEHQQTLAKGPRVLRLTSVSSMAAADAQYIHRWRDRIESIGNLHYPEEARRSKTYGDVRLMVSLNANGTVEEIRVLESSGKDVLDNAAIESIRLASPFEPFPTSLAEQYDRIEVIRTWQFRKDRITSSR